MPSSGSGGHEKYFLGWSDLPRWQRKAFHRENESRIRRGLKPLDKASVKLTRYNNGGY